MDRRNFLTTLGIIGLSAKAGSNIVGQSSIEPAWHGFNLVELYKDSFKDPIRASDFEMMKEFGFNFARIPLNYWLWSNKNSWFKIDTSFFTKQIDPIISYAKQNNIHVCFALHRAPGYCINRRNLEPYDLFKGTAVNKKRASRGFEYHWNFIANRYKDVSIDILSFNLLNEPPLIESENVYIDIMQPVINTIKSITPERKIIIDGTNIGKRNLKSLKSKNIIQSLHAYAPNQLTHYNYKTWAQLKAKNQFKWPFVSPNGETWDKSRLEKEYRGWRELSKAGGKVLVGEWGVSGSTPHDVTLKYMEDQLNIWKENNWSWALWNLRGTFGIIDSGRKDIEYEKYKGHLLDRPMLNLLRKYI